MIKIDEKHFEDILFEALKTREGIQKLNNRGLVIPFFQHSKVYRQLNLKEYGIPDIVRVNFEANNIHVDIIELKAVEFNVGHILQIGKYITGVRSVIQRHKPLLNRLDRQLTISAWLIVADFNADNDYTWLDKVLSDDLNIYSTKYDLEGMSFTKSLPANWHLTAFNSDLNSLVDLGELKSLFKNAYRANHVDDLPF